MDDPWTWTAGWELTVEVGGVQDRGEQWEKIGTTVIEQQLKKLTKTIKFKHTPP